MSKRISQFYQGTASTSKKFLMHDPTQSDLNLQDQLVDWAYVESLLTQGVNISILSLTSSVNTLSSQLSTKVDQSQVGVTVAPAVGGIVPAANLPFSLSSLVGTWDAFTNTPTLSDGTGVDKSAYLVSIDGTQNLGSGPLVCVAGNIVIHLGGTWQLVSSAVVLGVTSINGTLQGNVDLTTDIVAESTDKNYVTDDFLDALSGTSGIPSALNKYVTDNDPRLGGGGTSAGSSFNTISNYEVNGIASGNADTGAMTLTALGINSVQAAIYFPLVASTYGTIPGNITYDDACIYQALLYSKQKAIPSLHFTGKQYNVTLEFEDGFPLPLTLDGVSAATGSLRFGVYGYCTSMRLRTSGAGKFFFRREVVDETQSQAVVPYGFVIDGFKFEGDNDPTLGAVKLCSSKNSSFSNNIVRNCGIGLGARFCLGMGIYNNRLFNCNQISVLATDGDWPGASSSSSTTQIYAINNYITVPVGAIGWKIENADNCSIYGGVCEGSTLASCGIYLNNQSTTVVKSFYCGNIHIEQAYADAFLDINAQDIGQVLIENCFNQNASVLVRLNNVSGTNRVAVKNINKAGNQTFRNSGGTGGAFSFEDVKLNGNPVNPTQVIDTVGFPGIWDTSGSYIVPILSRVKINPLLL